MCEINSKRKKFYRLEIYTNHPISNDRWHERVYEVLIRLEQEFNERGDIRVHIHEE